MKIASRHGFCSVIKSYSSTGLFYPEGFEAILGLAITILKSRTGIAIVPSGSRLTSDVCNVMLTVSVVIPVAVKSRGLDVSVFTDVNIAKSC